MKTIKLLLFASALVIFAGCKKESTIPQVTPIPNGDFEDWNGGPLLMSWETNSCPACVPPFETYIVQRDPAAWHGKYAAKFIYNGVYAAWAANKFKLDSHPSTLTVYAKCNLYSPDTVLVKITIYKNSMAVDSGQWRGTSSIASYTKISIPITKSSMQADSAMIYIKGAHKFGPTSKSPEFWVDDFTLQ